MKEPNQITTKEQNFILSYVAKLNELQENREDKTSFVITNITLSFCIENNIMLLDLLFHPKSISYVFTKQENKPTTKEQKDVLEKIIQYELNSSTKSCKLNSSQLDLVIGLFRKI